MDIKKETINVTIEDCTSKRGLEIIELIKMHFNIDKNHTSFVTLLEHKLHLKVNYLGCNITKEGIINGSLNNTAKFHNFLIDKLNILLKSIHNKNLYSLKEYKYKEDNLVINGYLYNYRDEEEDFFELKIPEDCIELFIKDHLLDRYKEELIAQKEAEEKINIFNEKINRLKSLACFPLIEFSSIYPNCEEISLSEDNINRVCLYKDLTSKIKKLEKFKVSCLKIKIN